MVLIFIVLYTIFTMKIFYVISESYEHYIKCNTLYLNSLSLKPQNDNCKICCNSIGRQVRDPILFLFFRLYRIFLVLQILQYKSKNDFILDMVMAR